MVLFWVLLICLILAVTIAVLLFFKAFYNSSYPSKRSKPEDFADCRFMNKACETVYSQYLAELQKLSYELCYIKSFDGHKLCARYFEFLPGAPVDIMFHGYRGCAFADFCSILQISKKAGHNVLLVDERACGDSEGTVITMGIKENRDCLAWISYIRKRNGREVTIFLFGVSMGAATVLMASDKVPGNVKGIVSDCAYSSPEAILKKVAADMKIPAFVCYPLLRAAASVLGGFNLEESSALEAVAKTNTPILFIHGYLDSFVPYTMCGDLFEACSSGKDKKKMLTFNGADHAVSALTDHAKYENAVLSFFDECLSY